ncbi:MAG: DUF1326 domain-containing protein [Planctomycetes bacterium]|nr:DUF1326 domain-containing protein [Planctomycetota bacterium]
MARWILSVAVLSVCFAGTVSASEIKGQYVEARTCDVYTGACFANADTGIAGRNGVMAWRIETGTFEGVNLDGLGIVAVLSASETLGLKQSRIARSLVIVDEKATATQREALIKMAKQQSGNLLANIMTVRSGAIELSICQCKENSCAVVKAGDVRIETRCLDKSHDKGCGNDVAFYPPMSKGVVAKPAVLVEHVFKGKDFNETWSDAERRGAYVGTFSIR